MFRKLLTSSIEPVLYLCSVVNLKKIIPTKFNIAHSDAMFEEVDRELWCSI